MSMPTPLNHNPLRLLSDLVNLSDLSALALLDKYHKVLQLSLEIEQIQEKAETRRQAEESRHAEAQARKRLIAIILEKAKSKGIKPSELPNLQSKSYEQLCEYIREEWKELIACI